MDPREAEDIVMIILASMFVLAICAPTIIHRLKLRKQRLASKVA